MVERRKRVDADEFDAFGKYKHWFNWGPGVRRYIKNKANRRERREAKQEIKDDEDAPQT